MEVTTRRVSQLSTLYLVLWLVELVWCDTLPLEASGMIIGNVTFMDNLSIGAHIYDMKNDLHLSEPYLLFTEGYRLRTANLDTLEVSDVAGTSADHGYKEGKGAEARFNFIHSLVQRCVGTVLMVDTNNHCIRTVDRVTNNTVATAGKCMQEGHKDGDLITARFRYPTEISMGTSSDVYYIADAQSMRVMNLRQENVTTVETGGPPRSLYMGYDHLYFSVAEHFMKLNFADESLESLTQAWSPEGSTNQTCDILVLAGDIIVRPKELESLSFNHSCTSRNESGGLADLESCEMREPCQMLWKDDMESLIVSTEKGLLQLSLSGMNFSMPKRPHTSCSIPQSFTSTITPRTSSANLQPSESAVSLSVTSVTHGTAAAPPAVQSLNTTASLTARTTELHQTTARVATITKTSLTTENETSTPTTIDLHKKEGFLQVILSLDVKWLVLIGIGIVLLVVLLISLIVLRRRICTCCRKQTRKGKEDSVRELYALGTHDGQPRDAYDYLLNNNGRDEDIEDHNHYTRGPMNEMPVTFKSTQSPAQPSPKRLPSTGDDNSYYIRITNDEPVVTSALLHGSSTEA